MDTSQLPAARIASAKRSISPVWAVPIAALVVSAWLVYRGLIEHGPTVTIHFDTAEGIEVSKTRVRYLSVELGVVTGVRLAADGRGVAVEAELVPGSESRLTDSTRFWIVRPRLEATGVSGLGTLFSGAYIGMDPGEGGARRDSFVALAEPPRLLSHQSGGVFRLRSPTLGSLSIGSPVYFRQIPVGSVVGYELAEDHSHVQIEVFVEAPHDGHISMASRFWNVSGVHVDASAEGLQVDLESLVSLATGGIAFETPEGPGRRNLAVPAGHLFHLHANRRESRAQAVVGIDPFLVYFDESVRGLKPDAPVEFRGLRVGSVREILRPEPGSNGDARIGVVVRIDPGLLPFADPPEPAAAPARRLAWLQGMVDQGVRAQLQTGNLLTGQRYVNLDVHAQADAVVVAVEDEYPVIPSLAGSLQGLTESAATILARIEQVPFEQIGQELQGTLRGTRQLLDSENVTNLLGNANRASVELAALSADAGKALVQFEATMRNLQSVTSEDGVIGHELLQVLREMSAAARAMRAMAEYLERHPEALVTGKK